MNPAFDHLKRPFHEPKRLAIVSELCTNPDGLTFPELKTRCELTDGNLNRHLKMLADEGIIEIRKKEQGGKNSKTTAKLTDSGLNDFLAYLNALEEVLQNAATAARQQARNLNTDHTTHGAEYV